MSQKTTAKPAAERSVARLTLERDNLAQQRDEFWKDLTAARQENVRLSEELERLKRACEQSEAAIRACPALKDWGHSNAEHLASRVNNVCRMYDNSVATLLAISDQRDSLLNLVREMWDGILPFAEALKSSEQAKMIVEVGRPPEPHELVTQKQWEALSELVEQASVILAGTNTSLKQVPAYGPLLELVREMLNSFSRLFINRRLLCDEPCQIEENCVFCNASKALGRASVLLGEINP